MAIVPVGSLPLFAFASDGSRAWLRASGSRLLAVDTKTGEVLREVRLDPAPFGLTWHVERHGDVFVVRDDREIAAYGDGGARLWKRTWPTKLAIVPSSAPREDGKRISVAPGPMGVDVVLADLAIGAFDPKLRVPGTMDYVGANGVLVGDMLFFATDQREAYAIDTRSFAITSRHELVGSQILPPVSSPAGVHVAVIERRSEGSVTRVSTLDGATGAMLATSEMPGEAYRIEAGASGLVLDITRRGGTSERVAFRPAQPHVRLALPRQVTMNVVRDGPVPAVQILPVAKRVEGRRDEILPVDGGTPGDDPGESPRDAWLALLALLDARSEVVAALAEALAVPGRLRSLAELGLELADPRVRWNAQPGRDPCLVPIGRLGDGATLATYLYPPGVLVTVPVVRVEAATGATRWMADDLDAWLAGFFHEKRRSVPDLVAIALHDLGLPATFAREHKAPAPPLWFAVAHDVGFALDDADAALAAGDIEGAERILVALGRRGRASVAKDRLVSVYEMLGWAHQRAIVAETW